MKKTLMTAAIALLWSSAAFSAGFALGEGSARASSMGNAVVAQAYSAETMFYNPAGIGFLEGTHFNATLNLIQPKAKFVRANFQGANVDDTIYEAQDQTFPPVGLYASHRLNDKLALGLSFSTPFGLGFAWDKDFPGRFISRDVALQSFYISPVVAFRAHERLSIAAGLDVVISHVNLERHLLAFSTATNPGTEVGESQLEGNSGPNIGFTVSAMYQAERFNIGIAYRHEVQNDYEDADVTFTLYDTDFRGLVANSLTAGGTIGEASADMSEVTMNGQSAITFPASINGGIYVKLADNFGVEADVLYTFWNVFDELDLEFDNPALNQTIPEEYEDAIQVRFGAHYDVTENFILRAGYIYDETPQPIQSVSPLLPDDTRNDYTFGIGYKRGNMTYDAGFMYVDTGDRSTVENGVGQNDSGFDGTYSANATLFFFGIGYHLQ